MAKMCVNVLGNNIVAINLSLFCDLELILGLHAILPFLDFVHTLIKLTQSHDVFICDFVNTVKVCQLDLYYFYFDPYTKFEDLAFDELKTLESLTSKNLPMSWCEDMNCEEVDCLINEFVGAKFFVNQHYLATSAPKLVLKLDFPLVMAHVKSSCENYV